MNKTITVLTKDVYGQEKIYPVSEEAIKLAKLAGTKTLTPAAIQIIKSLGYSIIEQPRSY
jgi:hypothetical protein